MHTSGMQCKVELMKTIIQLKEKALLMLIDELVSMMWQTKHFLYCIYINLK